MPVLRRRGIASERRFTLPFGWLIPALGICASIFILTGLSRNQALAGAAGLASGALAYVLFRRSRA